MMLDLAIRAAQEAGRVLREWYSSPQEIESKGLRDIVTAADLEAERVILSLIRKGCPDARFVSEESYSTIRDYGDFPTWYIDPLDGTTNFARAIPGFSVSVAMAQRGVILCGAVYDPLMDQLFYAERGQGAYLNGERLRVSARDTLASSLVMLDWPRAQTPRDELARFLAWLAMRVDAVRSRGSAALGFCAVAAGWAEAYYQLTLGPWDVAAGTLLVEEAGGRVTDVHGKPHALNKPDWLASNDRIHALMLDARQEFSQG